MPRGRSTLSTLRVRRIRYRYRRFWQLSRRHREAWASTRSRAPNDRPAVAAHRAEIAEILSDCDAIAIAGGHVASLLNRLRLFGITELARGKTIFAWCAGAMAISERVVLFHDSPPQGPRAELHRNGGSQWIEDPRNPNRARDPFGANSVLQSEDADDDRPSLVAHAEEGRTSSSRLALYV